MSEKKIKILGICGSPRKNRSCDFLVDESLKGAFECDDNIEIEKLYLIDYKLQQCTGCDQCLREPFECPLSNNDDFKKLEEKIFNADAILMASPCYFGSVSSLTKTLIDRSRPWKMANYKLKEILFAPMAASGLRNGGAEGVISDLINFALIQGMICFGALGNPVIEENIPITSLQKYGRKEFIAKGEFDELGQRVARNLGKRAVELIKKMKNK
jgi:multimeric flavodoxin WrbA